MAKRAETELLQTWSTERKNDGGHVVFSATAKPNGLNPEAHMREVSMRVVLANIHLSNAQWDSLMIPNQHGSWVKAADHLIMYALGRTLSNAGQKSAPEELIIIVLLPRWAGVGSRAELPVCGGAMPTSGRSLPQSRARLSSITSSPFRSYRK